MSAANEEKIERLVKGALSDLPLRRAPGSLERRVLSELAIRAGTPWWRRNFAQWPSGARVGFIAVCAVLAGLSLTGGWMPGGEARALVWAQPVLTLMASIGGAVNLTARMIPLPYLYAALSLGAVLYAALFGLGAVAYRTLYLPRPNDSMIKS